MAMMVLDYGMIGEIRPKPISFDQNQKFVSATTKIFGFGKTKTVFLPKPKQNRPFVCLVLMPNLKTSTLAKFTTQPYI